MLFDVFDDLWWFVRWHVGFCIVSLIALIVIGFCLYLWVQRERYKKLQIAYNFLPDNLSSVDLMDLLGRPNSQYAGAGIVTWHYHFRLGFSTGVYMFTVDSHTGSLIDRSQKMF